MGGLGGMAGSSQRSARDIQTMLWRPRRHMERGREGTKVIYRLGGPLLRLGLS